MPRAAAIILQDGKIALMERHRQGRHYFIFPGGGVDAGETLEVATVREVWEELGLQVTVDRLIAEVWFEHTEPSRRQQYFFLAFVTGGVFGTGQGEEMCGGEPVENGTYTPVWMPITELLSQPVYPRVLAEIIVNAMNSDWPLEPVSLVDQGGH